MRWRPVFWGRRLKCAPLATSMTPRRLASLAHECKILTTPLTLGDLAWGFSDLEMLARLLRWRRHWTVGILDGKRKLAIATSSTVPSWAFSTDHGTLLLHCLRRCVEWACQITSWLKIEKYDRKKLIRRELTCSFTAYYYDLHPGVDDVKCRASTPACRASKIEIWSKILRSYAACMQSGMQAACIRSVTGALKSIKILLGFSIKTCYFLYNFAPAYQIFFFCPQYPS